MQFKIDENLPADAAELLRQAGHDVATVGEEQLSGHSDPAILAAAHSEGRCLITLDLDFSDIRAYPPQDFCGIVVLRPTLQAKPHVLSLLRAVLDLLQQESPDKALWSVDETGVRIRRASDGSS